MSKKVSFRDLFQVNIKYLEYLIEKSFLSHRYFKNISLTGEQIESEFRKILSNLLPARYKITHGYIAWAPSRDTEPIISGQIDIIIVDTLVPHSIFIIEEKGMEVVPLEAVVAFFEVKRTITPTILDEALTYLYSIQNVLSLSKKDSTTYFPGGVQGLGIMYANPLIGILSLDHKKYTSEEEYKSEYGKIVDKKTQNNEMPDLDIWTSLGSSLIMATCSKDDPKMLWAYTLREVEKKYPYLFKYKPDNNGLSQAYYLSVALGFILFYLSNITGRMPKLENYFFNKNI